MEPASVFPSAFRAGSTVKVRLDLVSLGHAADEGWACKLIIAGPALPDESPLIGGVDATAYGSSFDVALPDTDTANLTDGTYAWVARVSKDGESYDALSGIVTVLPNPASNAAAAGALQNPDEIELASIRAAIALRLTKDAARIQAFNEAIEREQLEQLYARERVLLTRIASRRRGGAPREPIRVAFTRP